MLNYLIIDDIIQRGLNEDMPFGDITTSSIIPEDSTCTVSLYVKEDGIICGLPVFERVFTLIGDVKCNLFKKDGDNVSKGEKIGEIKGNTQKVLMGERIGLNLLQRMSGIATTTNKYAKEIEIGRAHV